MKQKKPLSPVWYILILPMILIVYALAEHLVVDDYWVSYLPLDDYIPFCEWFSLAYVTWYAFLVVPGLWMLFTDDKGFKRYMLFLGISFLSAMLFCILSPNGQDLRPTSFGRDNLGTRIVAWLYAADTNTNVLPSMHVIGCYGAAATVCRALRGRKPWLRALVVAQALVICASTVLIKQHSILDVLVAVPWSVASDWITWRIVRRF